MTRHGACNHCGWCCQHTGQVTAQVELHPTSDVAFYRARGFRLHHDDGVAVRAESRVDIRLPCPQHVDERCAIYAERPRTCAQFPTHPTQIRATPCSYWFEDGEQRIGGRGSPYPWEG